ncbi:hypothetical protein [Arenibacter certesii]|uniref:hypothetical protein n=1 Tax=Arenibacter certesii TaxID=228955 RepID=UPI000479FE08|nr:hypothetical protein [Arenibacter certesii]
MRNCKKAELICTKIQYKEATILEKIQIRIHLILCRTCRIFVKKNSKLTSLCDQANLKALPAEEKEKMKKILSERQ